MPGSITSGHGENTPSARNAADAAAAAERAAEEAAQAAANAPTLATDGATYDQICQLLNLINCPTSDAALLAMAEQRMDAMGNELSGILVRMNDASTKIANIRVVTDAAREWEARNQGNPNASGDIPLNANGAPDGHVTFDLDAPATPQGQYPIVDPAAPGGKRDMTWREILALGGVVVPQDNRYFNITTMSKLLDVCKDGAQSISDDQEKTSLVLQELVGRRGQFTQLISQLLASERDTEKSIAQNTH